MKTFVVANYFDFGGEIIQDLIIAISKKHAIQKMLISQGWEVNIDDCTDEALYRLADMRVTAMEIDIVYKDALSDTEYAIERV